MLIVEKHCSDEFPMPQIDHKTKQVKEQENFICNQYGKKLAILNAENIKICGSITKPEATKMQFVCIFFHICWMFGENLNFQFPKVV